MRDRKEGLEPRIPLIQIARWHKAAGGEIDVGFGVTGFVFYNYRRRWWIDGTHRFLTEMRDGARVPRPKWKRETVECWRMLEVDFQIWNQAINVGIRLWKVKWDPTSFS